MTDLEREAIVARARGCIGARFRPHGRDPRFGLDCVGLAAIAHRLPAPTDYAMRGARAVDAAAAIDRSGLRRITPAAAEAADLLLIDMGQGQLHAAILTLEGFVHADARLRRIVETPGRPEGLVLAAWSGGV